MLYRGEELPETSELYPLWRCFCSACLLSLFPNTVFLYCLQMEEREPRFNFVLYSNVIAIIPETVVSITPSLREVFETSRAKGIAHGGGHQRIIG